MKFDESLFAKAKHNKGKDLAREQQWVFGIYDLNSKKCIFLPGPKRDAFHTFTNFGGKLKVFMDN